MTVIAMAHNKGGSGKTTSSVHIVTELMPDEIIDLDIHKGISIINGIRPVEKRLPVITFDDKKLLLMRLQELDEQGKLVFVDCGGFDSDLTQSAIAVADLILVPANDTMTERIGLSWLFRTCCWSKFSHFIAPEIQH